MKKLALTIFLLIFVGVAYSATGNTPSNQKNSPACEKAIQNATKNINNTTQPYDTDTAKNLKKVCKGDGHIFSTGCVNCKCFENNLSSTCKKCCNSN